MTEQEGRKKGLALGIDIGGTKTLFVLASMDGHILAQRKVNSHAGGLEALDYIWSEVEVFLDDEGISDRSVLDGVGVGVPSVVDPVNQFILPPPGVTLETTNVRGWFEERSGLRVVVDNDVNMAARGEVWLGAAQGAQDALVIAVGTGLGAGLVFNGKLHRGRRGFAGEIGHVQVNEGAPAPKVPLWEFGPMERMVSGTGIASRATELSGTVLSAKQVFAKAAAGDAVCRCVVDEAEHQLAYAIANMLTLLDVEIVVLGGGVAQAPGFVQAIAERIARWTPMACPVVSAKLGEAAGAVGAAAAVWRG